MNFLVKYRIAAGKIRLLRNKFPLNGKSELNFKNLNSEVIVLTSGGCLKQVKRMSVVGLSYGGFVGYSMASQYPEAVERLVICSAAVCMEERDLKDGVFRISDLEEAADILVPQTPGRLRELMGFTLYRIPPLSLIPSCLLNDFIQVSSKHTSLFSLINQ